jgi:hypothetical protein
VVVISRTSFVESGIYTKYSIPPGVLYFSMPMTGIRTY